MRCSFRIGYWPPFIGGILSQISAGFRVSKCPGAVKLRNSLIPQPFYRWERATSRGPLGPRGCTSSLPHGTHTELRACQTTTGLSTLNMPRQSLLAREQPVSSLIRFTVAVVAVNLLCAVAFRAATSRARQLEFRDPQQQSSRLAGKVTVTAQDLDTGLSDDVGDVDNVRVISPSTPKTATSAAEQSPGDRGRLLPSCEASAVGATRYCALRSLLSGNADAANRLFARKRHYLTTCTAVRDAGDTLHEFIVRNYLAGVDHFIIYDDNIASGDNVTQLLSQLQPLYTLARTPSERSFLHMVGRDGLDGNRTLALVHRQHMMYWHCFLTYGETTNWLLPLDADEFVEAKRPSKLETGGLGFEHFPFMQAFLRQIEDEKPAQSARWNSVLTNSKLFPTLSNQRTLSERFPVACGIRDEFANHTEPGVLYSAKSAVQPRYLDYNHYKRGGYFFVHGVKHWGRKPKELFFTDPYRKFEMPVNTTETQWTILHYWCRSLAEYNFKKRRGSISGLAARSMTELSRRERWCHKENRKGESESARLRQHLVSDILGRIDSFQSVQDEYYAKVSSALDRTRFFRALMHALGEVAG